MGLYRGCETGLHGDPCLTPQEALEHFPEIAEVHWNGGLLERQAVLW